MSNFKQSQVPCTEMLPNQSLKGASQSMVFSAITLTKALWKPGDKGTITITFGDYDCEGCSPGAAWSQIGNYSNTSYPSMNLGFIDPPYGSFTFNGVRYSPPADAFRNYCGSTQSSCPSNWVAGSTVIHEFGHALGMLHEHQNNLGGSNPVTLSKENVLYYYNCIGLGDKGAYTNVLERYDCIPGKTCLYAGTKYDPESIMLYQLSNPWVKGCPPYSSKNMYECKEVIKQPTAKCANNPTKVNFKLSKQDIGWLQQQYPLNSNDPPVITVKFIDRNPTPWKVAWVQKMVTETFPPIIGVKWIFETDNILEKGVEGEKGDTTESTTVSTTESTTESTSKPFIPFNPELLNLLNENGELILDENGNVKGTSINRDSFIAMLVICCIVGLIIIVGIIYFITKMMLIKNSKRFRINNINNLQ